MRLYVKESVMHDGKAHEPGAVIDCDVNDAAALLASGRATTTKPASAVPADKPTKSA